MPYTPDPESLFGKEEMSGDATPTALTLHEYTSLISQHIAAAPHLARRWVVAEVSRIGVSGPHCYCELIQKDAQGRTLARINGTIWSNNWRYVSGKFMAATGRGIAAGMKVMFLLSANHSPAYGLSANVLDVDPTYTLGDAERRRREILARLQQEGLLDLNKRTTLPPNPQKIAVISAAGAAGYGDFVNQIESSGYAFYPLLYPAAMQGANTAPSVMAALERIEMAVDFWDCVVIIRGGGATDDLNSFDDLELARSVARFPLPVIVGIGHERDRTVLDEIVHTRCKTPTAVAAFLTECLQSAEQTAEDLARKVVEFTRMSIMGERQRIAEVSALLPHLAPRRLETERHRLEMARQYVAQCASKATSDASRRLTLIAGMVASASTQALARPKERLAATPERMRQAVDSRLLIERQRLDARKGLIDVLSPSATLRRGYSITRVNGKAVRTPAEVAPGDVIITSLSGGEVRSVVEKTSDSPNKKQ